MTLLPAASLCARSHSIVASHCEGARQHLSPVSWFTSSSNNIQSFLTRYVTSSRPRCYLRACARLLTRLFSTLAVQTIGISLCRIWLVKNLYIHQRLPSRADTSMRSQKAASALRIDDLDARRSPLSGMWATLANAFIKATNEFNVHGLLRPVCVDFGLPAPE